VQCREPTPSQSAAICKNRLRGNPDFASRIKTVGLFKIGAQKYCTFVFMEIAVDCLHPASLQRDVRVVTNVGRNAVDVKMP
jgi:hypothetical protein